MSYEIPDLFAFDSGTRHQSSERLTPHKLTIMALVYEYQQLCALQEQASALDPEQILTETDKRIFMVILLNLLQSPDMDLKTLRLQIDVTMKPVILESVYELLRTIAQTGVKPIGDFFDNVSTLLITPEKDGVIRRESIMGLYIRRMELAYNEMSFSQVVDMFNKVRRYFEAGFPEAREEGDKQSWQKAHAQGISESSLSMSLLEEHSTIESLQGQSIYSKKQAEYFIAHQALMLSHHELKALPPDQLQQKISDILSSNPDMAEAHFLNYINSMRVKEYCTAVHNLYHYFDRKACTPNDGHPGKKKTTVEEVAMRYAALNLASLQYRFGNKNECKAALNEAIRLSQESNDQICLQHALVWLNLLGENHSGLTQLERSIRKTIDLSLPNLTVLGLNWISKDLGMGTETPARELCSLDSQIVLNLNTSINGVYYNGQAVCIAMCNLAQQHADLGDYSAATEILSQARQRFPLNMTHADLWQACLQRVAFTRAMYSRRLGEAGQALINLQAVDAPEAEIRKPMLLKEQEKITEAFACLDHLLTVCDKEKSGYHADFRCRVLLQLAELYIATDNHSSAVIHITDCIAHAKKHYLELYEALAHAYLAFVQLNTSLPEQGMRLIESQLTRILTNASVYDKARVLYVYARCKVAAAKVAHENISGWKPELISALELMSTVSGMFKSVEAHMREKDALYYQAMLYHEIGNKESRNKCAHQFKVLDKLYPTLGSVCVNVV